MKSVRIVHLDPVMLVALAAGELPLVSPVPLTDQSFGFAPVRQQWNDEDGPETVHERPA